MELSPLHQLIFLSLLVVVAAVLSMVVVVVVAVFVHLWRALRPAEVERRNLHWL
jgi:hypothetical protein